MHVRIVTFRLEGLSHDDYVAHCEQIADRFTEWPGLIAKIWLDDPHRELVGGVYLFESAAAAHASRDTALFGAMATNPAFADLLVEEFAILEGATAITAPPGLSGSRT